MNDATTLQATGNLTCHLRELHLSLGSLPACLLGRPSDRPTVRPPARLSTFYLSSFWRSLCTWLARHIGTPR